MDTTPIPGAFTAETTEGYTAEERAALNAELSRRQCMTDDPSEQWEIGKQFADEVAGYPLPSAADGLTVVIGLIDSMAFLMDGTSIVMPCDVAREARPGIMAATFLMEGGQWGSIWYWPEEGRAAVMMGADSVWYDCHGSTLRSEDGEEIEIADLLHGEEA